MDTLRVSNLALRFFLELAALTAFGYWGATSGVGRVLSLLLALGLPSIVAALWGLFISPKARFATGALGRASLGLLVFLLAAAALWSRGRAPLAATFASLAVVSSVLVFIFPQSTPDGAAR
jgi:hypothetical protein